jgi:hypothetical protein
MKRTARLLLFATLAIAMVATCGSGGFICVEMSSPKRRETVFNRLKKLLSGLLPDNPREPGSANAQGNAPDSAPARCTCGGLLFVFKGTKGRSKPELVCPECDRFSIHPSRAECN